MPKDAKSEPSPRVDERVMIAQLKGSAEFRNWLSGLAQSERMTVVQFLEIAAVEAAERRKYPTKAPMRTVGR